MEKLNMQTPDMVDENIKKIGELFPNCITERKDSEGKVEYAIDFDVLKQELSKDIVSGEQERYAFTWPNKKEAIRLANSPINKTLRPIREKSVDFENTQNIYIEGDNLDALKLLRENYLHGVKMIYFDPPYNTGSDFVYKDNFSQAATDYVANSGQTDENGNQLVANKESNGRFHTDWLNMIYPRLKVCRDLLSDDGVVAISIDDNEQKNLKNICDEIFGGANFLAQVVWERSFAPISLKKHFSVSHDYILFYAKNIAKALCNGLPRTEESNSRYQNIDNDPRGPWQSDNSTVGPAIPEKVYELTLPSGRKILPPNGRCWLYTKERFKELIADNRIWFGPDGNNVPRVKRFLSEVKSGLTPMTIWKYSEVGHSQEASQNLKKLFGGRSYFDYPKPVGLIKRCLALYTDKDSLVLDFFSGSATTAQAVMELNAEDGGTRKYILVQLPEATGIMSSAYEDGLETICDVGEERIRRAGNKIIEELEQKEADLFEQGKNKPKLDTGFRVFRIDSSNMTDVFYRPKDYTGNLFDYVEDNIKTDRTPEDLLFQVMLETDIPLSAKIEKETIDGKEFFNVADGVLIASFDKDLTDEAIIEVAKRQPMYFVMRNSSAASDSVITNFDTIFKTYSKDTVRKIL